MKKYLNIAIFLTLVGAVVLSPVARAEDGNRGPGGAGFRDERKALIQTFRDDREEFKATMKAEREAFVAKLKSDRETFLAELKAKKEEFKNKTLEAKNEWRGRALTMIGTSFEMAIRNLERIQTRVGEIIDGLDDEDTTDAEALLALSKEKLETAKDKLVDIKELLPESGEKITVEIFEQIKSLAREAKDLLKESRHTLVQAIKEVKGLGEENDEGDDTENDDDEE
ncbi:hypothetical protein A3I95_02100 [Candidatus Nomurabacteria bacterium RIFCSPLOWO2_02_FULL_44_12]|uniref:DUF5667 domain-containing protein n=1 Tax=Candidatus Nomurabacteria bacterium RIFCSPLOWO2_12_FULL_44_11 TaxID=1801796 RepID=A0A1F6Y5X7_9BACT|nr:MAG: hypothetical protein A3E95_01910 [Candidatus Nomurabacteria bacterium RIFCSPHIGHO2_12_FULL_44_22b]OGJ01764.1 MAG: hypothetical protein A3G53_00945 [Candidatus Nomurabacteria bacterium RIFCSPLOWO2_12_FULL_44_11]OGJ07284.1 MAG: hypothetical protein A3I95_02100 [Candidatus Nomurabacteria bacterium RIFCSPLOWO2_02_FULL_44_12]